MIKKILMILSYFLIPVIIIVFKNLEKISLLERSINEIEWCVLEFWLFLLVISIIATVIFCHDFKKGIEETRMDKNKIKLKDSKYNLHIFEYWFLIISPCIIFSGTNIISLIAILFVFLIIGIILYKQNLFIFNIILIIIGYSFYLIQYENNEYIICTKKSYSELKTSLRDDIKLIRINNSNYFHVK